MTNVPSAVDSVETSTTFNIDTNDIDDEKKSFISSSTGSIRMGYINIPDTLEYHKYYKNNYRLLLPFIITFIQYLFYDRWFLKEKASITVIAVIFILIALFSASLIIYATILYPLGYKCKFSTLMNGLPEAQSLEATTVRQLSRNDSDPNHNIHDQEDADNDIDQQNQPLRLSHVRRSRTMASIDNDHRIKCKCLLKLIVFLHYIYENSTRFINQFFNPGYIKLDINKKQEYQLLRLLLPDSEKKQFIFAVCVACYASIIFIIANLLLVDFKYSNYCYRLLEGDKDGTYLDKQHHWDGCLFKYSSFSPHYSLVAVCILFMYYRKANTECHKTIINEKKIIIESFARKSNKNIKNNKNSKNNKSNKNDKKNHNDTDNDGIGCNDNNNNNIFRVNFVKYLDNNVQATLAYWKEHKFLWVYDRITGIILFVFCVIGQIVVSHFRNDLFDDKKFSKGYIAVSFILCIIDGLIASILILLEIRLCRHFEFPSVIMESLSLSMRIHLDKYYWCKNVWNENVHRGSMFIPTFLQNQNELQYNLEQSGLSEITIPKSKIPQQQQQQQPDVTIVDEAKPLFHNEDIEDVKMKKHDLEDSVLNEATQNTPDNDDTNNGGNGNKGNKSDKGDNNNDNVDDDEIDEKMLRNDLRAWWKLRKFYIHNVIFHMSCTFEQAGSVSIVLSIAIGFISIYQIIFEKAQVLAYFIIFWTITVMMITFLFCANAVKYLKSQRKHLLLLQEIKLQLRSKAVSENMMNFIDDIDKEISNDLVAMKAFGLDIDSNFMSAVNVLITGFISAILVEAVI